MLNSNKSISLTGQSMIDGQVVISLNANVSKENAGNTYVNQTIINKELYQKNISVCRKDIQDFQAQVWEVEDQLIAEEAAAE